MESPEIPGRLTALLASTLDGPRYLPLMGAEFVCLPLGENPSAYDCYLVRERDVEPA